MNSANDWRIGFCLRLKDSEVTIQNIWIVEMIGVVGFFVCRKEAVTLPENEEADFGDVEQARNIPKFPNFMEFQQTYISMVTKSIHCVWD